jgi:hypothetical protein
MSCVENIYVDDFASRRIAARLVADESGGTAPVHYFVTATRLSEGKLPSDRG